MYFPQELVDRQLERGLDPLRQLPSVKSRAPVRMSARVESETLQTSHVILIQELVGTQLERGFAPLRQLPAAVAAEVVEEMRAAALQLLPQGFADGGGGAVLSPATLMLDDGSGSGLSWQVRLLLWWQHTCNCNAHDFHTIV